MSIKEPVGSQSTASSSSSSFSLQHENDNEVHGNNSFKFHLNSLKLTFWFFPHNADRLSVGVGCCRPSSILRIWWIWETTVHSRPFWAYKGCTYLVLNESGYKLVHSGVVQYPAIKSEHLGLFLYLKKCFGISFLNSNK
jgi:hypothetical protein